MQSRAQSQRTAAKRQAGGAAEPAPASAPHVGLLPPSFADLKVTPDAGAPLQLRKRKQPYFKGGQKMSLGEFHQMVDLEKKREAQSVGPEFDMEMLTSTPQQIYRRLPPSQKWREHIDGKHQHHGRDVYKQGLHRGGEDKDPDYNEQMMQADLSLGETFGRNFTVDDYVNLRNKVAPDRHEFGSQLRTGPSKLEFPDLIDSRKDVEHPLTTISHTRDNVRIGLNPTKNPLRDVDRILKAHYEDVGKSYFSEDKLKIIARTHRDLENLHPYVDKNTRTNRLVLNRLLAEQRQPMTLLHDPLSVHVRSPEGWTDQIRDAQKSWAEQAKKTPREESEKRWDNFDKFRKWFPKRRTDSYVHDL